MPGLRTRGLDRVVGELSARGYDSRWRMLSAADVGAPHMRKRWFLLAYNPGFGREKGGTWAALRQWIAESPSCSSDVSHSYSLALWLQPGRSSGTHRDETSKPRNDGESKPVADSDRLWEQPEQDARRIASHRTGDSSQNVADTPGPRLEIGITGDEGQQPSPFRSGWWESESRILRVVNGCPHRVDRITALGNGEVPLQAREAFKSLMFGSH